MRHKTMLALIATILVASGCGEKTYTPEFLTDDKLRMEVGRQEILSYNPLNCQYAYNSERLEFRLHTDTMSDYVIIKLASLPSEEGETITARTLVWTSRTGADQVRNDIALEVVKLEGDTMWLWNSRESIRMTVRFR